MILLDTDVCLALFMGNRKLIEGYSDSTEELCVTTVTVQELFYAANSSSNPEANKNLIEKFLLTLTIVHPDLNTLKYASEVQTKNCKKGIPTNYSDVLIYSLSKTHNARLITADSKRYCFT